MPYIGNQPGTGVRNRFIYTATASQTTFSGADDNGKTLKYADSDFVDVFLNGVCLVPAVDYTSTTKTSVVLTQAASLNDTLEVVAYDIATIADTVSKADGGTFNGDLGITNSSPDITLTNNTTEDTDGGRESTVTFKGLQSGGEESTLAEIRASHDGTSDDQKGDLIFKTNDGSDGASPTTAMVIDSSQNVGIGTTTPSTALHVEGANGDLFTVSSSTGSEFALYADGNEISFKADADNDESGSVMTFDVDSSENFRVSDGKLMVGKTTAGVANAGAELRNGATSDYAVIGTSVSQAPFIANRTSTHGDVFRIRKDNSPIATHLTTSYSYEIKSHMTEFTFEIASARQFMGVGVGLGPAQADDDELDLGRSSARYQDIYATNTSIIGTSDENEKQDIASLTSAEITAATAISKLFKTFKWKDAVTKKGDAARTHTGHIAQQVETAMSDAGLDASKYAFWCSNTWWESDKEGELRAYKTKEDAPEGATEHTRLGLRYAELLAFIGAATEQRLTSIEARLDALEAE